MDMGSMLRLRACGVWASVGMAAWAPMGRNKAQSFGGSGLVGRIAWRGVCEKILKVCAATRATACRDVCCDSSVLA